MPPKKKKNGKGKKGKKSKPGSGKDKGSLEEQKHKVFLEKLNSWLRANCGQLIEEFTSHDDKGYGEVSKEDFAEGLSVLKAPLTKSELHMVIKFLTDKPACPTIDYLSFARGITIPFVEPVKMTMEAPDIKLNVRDISTPKCTKCNMWFPPTERSEIRPRFVKLTLELDQFVEKDIPGNFTAKVTASLTVYGVKQLVQHRFGQSVPAINVYLDKVEQSYPLQSSLTLEELGFRGFTEDEPEAVTLYYNVHVQVHLNVEVTYPFYACPLLLTDHYFAKHQRNGGGGQIIRNPATNPASPVPPVS